MKKLDLSDNYNKPFASRLRELIAKANDNKITIQSVAKSIGITRQAVSQYYNGLTQPNAETIVKIAEYFNVSTDYLLGLTDNPTTNREIDIVYDYTGLSQTAIKRIRQQWNNPIVSKIIESAEFWDIVQNIQSALINSDTLNPSGKITADSAAAQMGIKINWNNNNDNVDLSNLPIEYQKYLGVVAQQGTKPLYKYQLTETIARLFDNIINDKEKG